MGSSASGKHNDRTVSIGIALKRLQWGEGTSLLFDISGNDEVKGEDNPLIQLYLPTTNTKDHEELPLCELKSPCMEPEVSS